MKKLLNLKEYNMILLLLLNLLIPTIAYTEEVVEPLPQFSGEQIARIEQLIDTYPAEDLLDTWFAFKPSPIVRAEDGWTITKILSEEELLEKLVFLSCDNKKKIVMVWHIPTVLAALTLHEKFLMATNNVELASEQEKKRINEAQYRIMRVNEQSFSTYRTEYLQELNLSTDELEVMHDYHHDRFYMEAARLLHTMLEKELVEKGDALQKSAFEKLPRVTNETIINPLKMDLIELLKKSKNDTAAVCTAF